MALAATAMVKNCFLRLTISPHEERITGPGGAGAPNNVRSFGGSRWRQ
jgi:hypothetical protein